MSFGDLSSSLVSSQMLQATDLVGRQVSTESNVGFLRPPLIKMVRQLRCWMPLYRWVVIVAVCCTSRI